VIAAEPNRFGPEHSTFLQILGRQVMTRLELYFRTRGQEQLMRAQQRSERALAIERCFVAATLDSIPTFLVVLDTAGRIVRMNSPCAQLTGLTLAEAVGKPFAEVLLGDDDRNWATEKLSAAAAGHVSGPHETAWRMAAAPQRDIPVTLSPSDLTAAGRFTSHQSPMANLQDDFELGAVTASSHYLRVSWTLRPLNGPSGEIQYLIVNGQDVTEQRQMETALLSSETRYRQIVENSLGFAFTCSMEGRITSLNALTAQTLGYRPEELNGRSVFDLLDLAGERIFQDCLHALIVRNEWQGSLPLRRRDGAFRYIALRSRRMTLAGEPPFAVHHGIDATEQHEAELALHTAMKQRELILESVGDGIFGIDLEGRITFVNQAAAHTLGYGPERLAGRAMHETIHHSQSDGNPCPRAASPILVAMQNRETVRMTGEVFWRQDGTPIPVEYSASPLVEGEKIAGMVVAFQDVSERRRLEKMKDEFISTVSHELRTPLTSLRASLGLISTGSFEQRPEKRAQMMDMAIANCDRLVRLVNNIVDFDGVRNGRLSIDRQPVASVLLLRRASDVAHAAAVQAQINFRIEAGDSTVLADTGRILQVLNELISNALKFSPPRTTIRLSAKPLEDSLHPDSSFSTTVRTSEICFKVEDQGRGIAADKLESIFDRFQQGDASDSRDSGGTGLGLALCRSIIEHHGGRLWAESTPEQGSCFLFTLPSADNPQ
jgi:PAS domain S-box-containing protein